MTDTDLGAFVPGPRTQLEPTGSGPLDGLTFVTKDLIDVAGSVTGGGNPDWHGQQTPAAISAVVVQRLLQAGAAMVGKTVALEVTPADGERLLAAQAAGTLSLALRSLALGEKEIAKGTFTSDVDTSRALRLAVGGGVKVIKGGEIVR